VVVTPSSSGKPRAIAVVCFERGEVLGQGKSVRAVAIRKSGVSEWDSAYVAAILRELAPD